MTSSTARLLEVEHLTVQLPTAQGWATAVRDVSFAIGPGETLGLIGESGCGKSMSALALMGLAPETARVTGSIRFEGRELLGLDERALCALRGDRLSMVFQEPLTALDPLRTVGRQIAEPLTLHRGLSAREGRARAIELLERVGLPDPARRVDAYPHELSGGQRQRVTIAMALACGPALLIADEPTTALDVTVQRQILDLIADLVEEREMAMLLISHDLGVIAQNVDRMLVMYGGCVVESGPTDEVFRGIAHPYAQGLMAARPRMGGGRGRRLAAIAGAVPDISELPEGCAFADRCPLVLNACRAQLPPVRAFGVGHDVRCLRAGEVAWSAESPDLSPMLDAGEARA